MNLIARSLMCIVTVAFFLRMRAVQQEQDQIQDILEEAQWADGSASLHIAEIKASMHPQPTIVYADGDRHAE